MTPRRTPRAPAPGRSAVKLPSPRRASKLGLRPSLTTSVVDPSTLPPSIPLAERPITIDPRDGSDALIHVPPLDRLARLSTRNLASGDVCFYGWGPAGRITVGIEVKRFDELVGAIQSGRLQATQAPALVDHYDIRWVVSYCDGPLLDYRVTDSGHLQVLRLTRNDRAVWSDCQFGKPGEGGRPVPLSYLTGALADLLDVGVNYLHVPNVNHLAHWIVAQHHRWSKRWDEHRGLHVFDTSRDTSTLTNGLSKLDKKAVKMLAGLPGIGYDRAMGLWGHFESLRDVANAGWRELAEAEGVGRVLGRQVEEMWGRTFDNER